MSIKKLLSTVPLFMVACTLCAQVKSMTINSQSFIVKSKKNANEWNTEDHVRELYIIKNGRQQYVLAYYPYKDGGGDCNNLFWTKENMKVKNNTITITTHHFQKTGRDPITEWEKKVFTVSKNGEVELTKQLYKKYGSDQWKNEEDWYSRK